MIKIIRLGTRGSPLALIQAEEVKRRLFFACPALQEAAEREIVPISTSGDWRPEHKDQRFIDMGGNKGMFTKEIEEALLSDAIDMAVHSVKDIASVVPAGISLAAVLERDDPRDALVCSSAKILAELPKGAIVGTSSLRRQAQVLALRPDLRVVPLRGNVETRLKKISEGIADATVLAAAGLKRLNLGAVISSSLSIKEMLPAAAQGALGVEIREGDDDMRAILKCINDDNAMTCITAERAVMQAVDGNCSTPAGAYATITPSGLLAVEALVARPDGSEIIRLAATGAPSAAGQVGEMLGDNLRRRAPADMFSN